MEGRGATYGFKEEHPNHFPNKAKSQSRIVWTLTSPDRHPKFYFQPESRICRRNLEYTFKPLSSLNAEI